jgi:prolyl-tRNA editing enzyme YbaK/EbsC (Cys-tRNA(Pro) deacylase)
MLKYYPLTERRDLVAPPVLAALEAHATDLVAFKVVEIDPAYSDTEAYCKKYGVEPAHTANTMIVEAVRAGTNQLAVVVMVAADRADINGKVRKALGARRVSLAPRELAEERSDMEFGGITAIGLPVGWPVLVDERVLGVPLLTMGSGIRQSKLLLPGGVFATWPNARLMNLLKAE